MTKTINGRYRLDERIGAGGMGEVWRGEDLTLHRTVAVKMLHSNLRDDDEQKARFEAEARTLAQIHHPNVVDVYDFGHDGGSAYIVMEFVPGRSLGEILRDKSSVMTPERTAGIMAQAAEALDAVHKRGIIHRDIKPDNLMVKDDGTVVLSDFGIARMDMSMSLTAEGSVIGTAYYMSPEQVTGKQASPASDQYALGIVTFRCLAGELPFDATTPMDVALKQLGDPVPDLPPGTPEPMVTAVLRSLRKKPEDRYPDCKVFARALSRIIPKGETTASMAALEAPAAPLPEPTRVMPPAPEPTGTFKATARPVPPAAKPKRVGSARPVAAAPPAAPAARAASTAAAKPNNSAKIAAIALACVVVLGIALFLVTREGSTAGDGASGDSGANTGVEHTTEPGGNDGGGDTTDNGNGDGNGNGTGHDPGQTTEPNPGGGGPSAGNGGNDTKQVQVPNVVGQDLNTAGPMLNHAPGGTLIMDFGQDESGDPDACKIVRQDPQAGTVVPEQTHVKVFVHPKCSTSSN